MRILGKRHGEAVGPLEEVRLAGVPRGVLSVCDGVGREYLRVGTRANMRFTVGGALGTQRVRVLDEEGKARAEVLFLVDAQTQIRDAGGEYQRLLQLLLYTMTQECLAGSVRWEGQTYRYLVCWLRDHVHALKGMKYFTPTIKEGIELYLRSQRADGMVWDNVYPRGREANYWDMTFGYDGFVRAFADRRAEFRRIPVENDVEYILVEGIYNTWKATGDEGWMAEALDGAVRAMNYSLRSPYRFSKKYGLLKRGFTIDTWDFLAEGESPNAMVIDKKKTRYGVMFGDNTGYAASCGYLAQMLERVGRGKQAAVFRKRGASIRRRLDKLAWNGKFFRHHVSEDARVRRELGVDQEKQVSLSNAYSLNRGITQGQAEGIVESYRKIGKNLPVGSPGEWYTIYPPFGRGFDAHARMWQYVNGGVSPIVAGELAHGAFEHGFEEYGVDILRRVQGLAERLGDKVESVYTGSIPDARAGATAVDISAQANIGFSGVGKPGVVGWTGEADNDLHEAPTGRRMFCGIPLLIADPAVNGGRGCIGVSTRRGYGRRVEIGLGREAGAIYLLHTVSRTQAGGVGGTLTLQYADGTTHTQYIVRGQNVLGWWMPEEPVQQGRRTVAVAWRGKNRVCPNVGLTLTGFDNPHPGRRIEKIILEAAADGAMWMVAGVSYGEGPAQLGTPEISYGIPASWAGAAVTCALVEGLLGVVDAGAGMDRVKLRPRWGAAKVEEARVTVRYAAGSGYVAYAYRHRARRKIIELEMTGNGERCECGVMLPGKARRVLWVKDGEERVEFRVEKVRKTRYVNFEVDLRRPRRICVAYGD